MKFGLVLASAGALALTACNGGGLAGGESTNESAAETGEIRLTNTTIEKISPQTTAAAKKNPMQAGEWEVTSKILSVETPGVQPGPALDFLTEMGKRPPETTRSCQTPQPFDIERIRQTTRDCVFSRYEVANGRIDVQASCKGPAGNPVTLKATGTFSATASDLTVETDTQAPAGEQGRVIAKVQVTSKRVGECRS